MYSGRGGMRRSVVAALILSDVFGGSSALRDNAGDCRDDLEAFVAGAVGRAEDLGDRVGRQDPGYGGKFGATGGSQGAFWVGHGSDAGDAPDCFDRFCRECVGDAGGGRAHDGELAFGVVQAVGPLIDVSIDYDPGQRLGVS